MTFARVGLTNCLPVYIFNAGGITAIAAWRTLPIGKRAKPVTKLADTRTVPKATAAPRKTANMTECARSDILSEPLDVGQYPLYIY